MSERGRDCENCKLAVNLEALNLSTYAANLEVSALLRRCKSERTG
nr:hypothetical protein [uncultured Campylobacter sp.]